MSEPEEAVDERLNTDSSFGEITRNFIPLPTCGSQVTTAALQSILTSSIKILVPVACPRRG
jgi:hypothetical protein